jgi:hypothetical protein
MNGPPQVVRVGVHVQNIIPDQTEQIEDAGNYNVDVTLGIEK